METFIEEINEVVPMYVKYPEVRSYSEEEIAALALCTTELDLAFHQNVELRGVIEFHSLYDKFNSGDDYALIDAFLLSHELKIFPPLWVLKGMNDRFTKWNEENLKGSNRMIDEFFKTGGKTAFRERCYQGAYDFLFIKYVQLKFYWELSDADIFGILERFADEGRIKVAGNIQHTRLKFTERTIRELHREKEWKRGYETYSEIWQERHPCLTHEEVTQFLAGLPESARDTVETEARRNPTNSRGSRKPA